MKKKFAVFCIFSLLVILTSVTAVSCATSPPPEEPAPSGTQPVSPAEPPVTPVPEPAGLTPAEQAAFDTLTEAALRATEARRRAGELDGQSFFPSDWDSAQSLLDQAEQQRNTSTVQNTRDSAERYTRAADAFDDIFQKALAEARLIAERQLAAAREEAIAAGAMEYAPDYLAAADEKATRALAQYGAGDYLTARDTAQDAFDMYNTIRIAIEAHGLRDEIADRGFERYDSDNVDTGDAALRAASAAISIGDIYEALDKATEALSRLSLALRTAWQTRAEQGRSEASAARQRALEIRANIAAREEFDPADTIFNRANTALNRENFEEAIELYDECIPIFDSSTRLAFARRQAAQDALDRADRRILESEQTAIAADQILEGGTE